MRKIIIDNLFQLLPNTTSVHTMQVYLKYAQYDRHSCAKNIFGSTSVNLIILTFICFTFLYA